MRKCEDTLNSSKGITLIALVVTIIILIILAGISISMLTGQNGILTRAAEAKRSKQTTISKWNDKSNVYRSNIKLKWYNNKRR